MNTNRNQFDLHSVLSLLSSERPLFHSEADFQHALAWKVHELFPEAMVRLEYRPVPNERVYIDIFLTLPTGQLALELKYTTRGHSAIWKGETFTLADQAAQDLHRYDFLKDLVRLQKVAQRDASLSAWAIMLTNDSAYWKVPGRNDSVDAAFRLHEGRLLQGTLGWDTRAGAGTVRKREAPLELFGRIKLNWRDYSSIGSGTYSRFRYLAVEVQANR